MRAYDHRADVRSGENMRTAQLAEAHAGVTEATDILRRLDGGLYLRIRGESPVLFYRFTSEREKIVVGNYQSSKKSFCT